MNRKTLREFEQSENLRLRAVEALAIALDIDYREAEEFIDEMNRLLKVEAL